MSIVLQALALFALQNSSPFDRVESMLKKTDGFTSDVVVSVTGQGTAKGTYSVRRPALQLFRLTGATCNEVFVQGRQSTLHIDYAGQEFTWYPAYKFAVEPPEEGGALLRTAIPLILTQSTLTKAAPKEKWASAGKETVGGHVCDVLTVLVGKEPSDHDPIRLWADSTGRVLRVRLVFNGNGGIVSSITELTNPTYSAPPVSTFDVKVPWGFMPSKVQEQKTVKGTGDRVELGSWTKLPSLEKVTMNSDEPTLVLVTSDDLTPEGDLKRWKGLAEKAKKAKVKFVQMWIGKRPASATGEWPSYWDKDGSFEDNFGPPATPYLFLVADKAVVSAWQGWSDGDETEAAKTLFSPLSRRR